jgi:endonuclease-3
MARVKKPTTKKKPAKKLAKKPAKKAAKKRAPRPRKPAAPRVVKPLSPDEQARVTTILGELARLYPDATCELDHANPFQLLAATILSAQCTDERVNMVTPELFRRWPDARALGKAKRSQVESVIKTTGFFRNKAKSLIGMSRKLVTDHDGEVPRTMEQMIQLPGVARKTANVVLGTAYGLATGVVVDTHVQRLTQLLKLTRHSEPKDIEPDLMAYIPQEQWVIFAHRLIWHGRRVCNARKPDCTRCPLPCPSRGAPELREEATP